MEIATADMSWSLALVRWASYLVLGVWAIHIARSETSNAMAMVTSTMGFFAALAVIEAGFDVNISAFDFTTTFGLMMMLGVLAGTLTAGNRLAWAGGVGLGLVAWSIVMGQLRNDPASVMGVRAITAATSMVFTTALVAKLYDELSDAIESHNRSRTLQDAIARCSEALLVQTDSFAVYEAVRALLEASEADYAYVDETTQINGKAAWRIVADAARRPEGYGNSWRTGTYESVPSSYGPLVAGHAVTIHTSDLDGEEKKLYEDDGILSELVVPIFLAGEFRGSIGFTQYTDDRRWSEAEIQTLWRASHMIGAFWQRQDDAADLRASNDSKERLLASVSHEIRTPLTAIVGLSEEILSGRPNLGQEELEELNGIIATQSRELAELVEDLLVASRADGGTLSIRPVAIDLRTQAEGVLRGVRESHLTSKTIIVHGDKVQAWADPLRVRQVMRNLVTNAIRYGGDRIVVGVRAHEGLAQVVVADNGPGVPTHESDLIFERYYRSDHSETQPGSVGIGLAVSRQLAEMMEGTLDYVRGSGQHRFELSLPLTVAYEERLTVARETAAS